MQPYHFTLEDLSDFLSADGGLAGNKVLALAELVYKHNNSIIA